MKTKIDNWGMVCTSKLDGYTPPEAMRYSLRGDVSAHVRLGNVKGLVTSTIIGKKGEDVIVMSGNTYELGTPDPVYEKMFPDSKKRLLATLKEVGDSDIPKCVYDDPEALAKLVAMDKDAPKAT